MGTRPDLSVLSVDLAARFAFYETHRFCIHMPAAASLLDESGANRSELDANTLATFLHEYMHFTHNVSTVCGWSAFELLIQLLGVFSHALDDNGIYQPNLLSESNREMAQSAAVALNLLEGARSLPQHPSEPVNLRVVDVCGRTELHLEVPFDVRDVYWEVTRRDGSVTEAVTPIGAFLIEEGIAYLLETVIRTGRIDFDDSWALDSGPPLFPYLAYQTLCRARAPNVSALAAIRIGLLALNFNRPGEALLRTLTAYERLRESGQDDTQACDSLRQQISPSLGDIMRRIRAENLTQLRPLFQNRGRIEEGIEQVSRWFSEGLSNREQNVWFDLGWCSGPALDTAALSTMLRESTPCDVIQERPGVRSDLGRDALIAFSRSPTGLSMNVLSGVRTLQAQFDFLLNHLTVGGLAAIAQGAGRTCPFFTICKLPMRNSDPATCLHHPWVLWNRDPTCWYGAAVAGTLGIVVQQDEVYESNTT